jgi:nicotinamidase-related amidase
MSSVKHQDSASYASAGFGTRIGWGSSPALLIIDVCKAYWTEGSPLDTRSNPASVASVPSMKALLVAAREGDCPVIWTRVVYNDMAEAGIFYLKSKPLDVWKTGDPRGLDAWVDGLVPDLSKGDIIIDKRYPSAFFGTDLVTRLNVLRADTLVICGVSTSGCVRASTLDTMQHGIRPMVSKSSSVIPFASNTILGRWLSLRRSITRNPRCEHV